MMNVPRLEMQTLHSLVGDVDEFDSLVPASAHKCRSPPPPGTDLFSPASLHLRTPALSLSVPFLAPFPLSFLILAS